MNITIVVHPPNQLATRMLQKYEYPYPFSLSHHELAQTRDKMLICFFYHTCPLRRMSQKIWSKTKHQPSRAKSYHKICQCLVSLPFLCNVMSPVMHGKSWIEHWFICPKWRLLNHDFAAKCFRGLVMSGQMVFGSWACDGYAPAFFHVRVHIRVAPAAQLLCNVCALSAVCNTTPDDLSSCQGILTAP